MALPPVHRGAVQATVRRPVPTAPTDRADDRVGAAGATAPPAPVTETTLVAAKPPLAADTVMMAAPAPTAVTTPLDDTVATAVLELDQVRLESAPVSKRLDAVSVPVVVPPPMARDRVEGDTVSSVTAGVTTRMKVVLVSAAPLTPTALVVAVMMALPAATAVTTPVDASTVATAVLLEAQLTVTGVVVLDTTEAVSACVPPGDSSAAGGDTVRLDTAGVSSACAQLAQSAPSASEREVEAGINNDAVN